jgi:hypothetical protein
MPLPTPPTVNSIVTEAFKRCGIASPTPAQLLRAEDEWLEEVKRDLSLAKRWHVLEETMVMIPQAFIGIYPKPSPLMRVLRMRFYDGVTGTATAGAGNSITIAAGTGTDTDRGRKIFLTGGTGAGQGNRIIGRTGDAYTVACAWTTNPASGTTYMIADRELECTGPDLTIPLSGLAPSNVIRYWDEIEDLLRVYPIPDNSTSALEIDGIVDVSLIDEADARLTRLLREWRTALIYGVAVRIYEDNDDENAIRYEAKYEAAKRRLMVQDSQKRRHLINGAMRSPGGLPRRTI